MAVNARKVGGQNSSYIEHLPTVTSSGGHGRFRGHSGQQSSGHGRIQVHSGQQRSGQARTDKARLC